MKRLLQILCLALLTGCVMPKPVEFGQKKVKPFPVAKASETEVQRQTAQRAAQRAEETFQAATTTQADPTVVRPAAEAAVLTEAVATSLGPPLSPAPAHVSSDALAAKLDTAVAKLEARIDDFRDGNDEVAGKKIEGTGFFQIGYFTQFLVLAVIIVVAWLALKIIGLFNPAVAVGSRVLGGGLRGVTHLAAKGFSEVIEGGEKFKEAVDKKFEDAQTREQIKELFRTTQMQMQSRDVQDVVRGLTLK